MLRFFSSIRGKLLLITGTGTALVLASALYGFWGTDRSQQQYQRLLNVEVTAQRNLYRLQLDLNLQIATWYNALLQTGNSRDAINRFSALEERVRSASRQLLKDLSDNPLRDDLNRFDRLHREMGKSCRDALTGNYTVAKIRRVEVEKITPLTELLDNVAQQMERQVDQRSEYATTHARDTIKIGLIAMALAVGFAFVQFNIFLQKFLLRPSYELSQKLKRMAGHDFSISISRHSNDELGDIAESTETIREAMLSMIRELHGSSAQLDGAVSQLTEVIEITRNGVEKQLHQTEQVATAISEMTASMQQVADHAEMAAESATSADGTAQNGRQIVTRTIEDIEFLAREIGSASDTIDGLKQESEKIGGVLDVIKDISAQTNLLALNASIEAARAGEQGRGFAVVADEVRALAIRTQRSTQEIEEMIEHLQAGAARAVEVMEKSRRHTRSSTEQSADAGTSLEQIAAAVTQITQMNAQIAEAAGQQLHVTEEINRNITNISEIAEYSAEGGKRIHEANTNLSGISQRLTELVKTFKIE